MKHLIGMALVWEYIIEINLISLSNKIRTYISCNGGCGIYILKYLHIDNETGTYVPRIAGKFGEFGE